MDDATARRMAENEARYRDLNERQVAASEAFRDAAPEFEISCECSIGGCEEMLRVTASTYARVRSNDTHFFVAPDHAIEGAERVVERTDHYWVVEKVGAGADVARERA